MGRLLDRTAEEEKKKKAVAPSSGAPLRFEITADEGPAPYVAPLPSRAASTPATAPKDYVGPAQTLKDLALTAGAVAAAPFRESSRAAFGQGWDVGVLGAASSLERAGAYALDKVGLDGLGQRLNARAEEDRQLSKHLAEAYGFAGDARPLREKLQDPDFIAGGLGQNLPNLLAALGVTGGAAVGGAPGLAVAGAGALTTASLEYGGAYNDARDFGVEDEETLRNVGLTVGIANAGLDALPFGRLLARTPGAEAAKKAIIRDVTRNVVKQMALEGGTESLQEINANAAARWYYDPNRDLLQGVGESAFFGSLLGGGSAVAVDVVQSADLNVARFRGPDSQRGFVKNPFADGAASPEDAAKVEALAAERKAKLEATPEEDMTPRHREELAFLQENAANPEAVADAYTIVPPGEEASVSLVPKTAAEAARDVSQPAEAAGVLEYGKPYGSSLDDAQVTPFTYKDGNGTLHIIRGDVNNVYLSNIYVKDKGKGTGSEMLRAVIADVAENYPGRSIRLYPERGRQAFYSRLGFAEDGDQMVLDDPSAASAPTPAAEAPASAADFARTGVAPEVALEPATAPVAKSTAAQRSVNRSLRQKPTLGTREALPGAKMVTETASEKTRLNNRLRAEQSVAKLAAKATKESIREAKTAVRDYVADALPLAERGKFLTVLKNAETPADVARALVRVEAAAAEVRKRDLVSRIGRLSRRALSSPSVSVEAKDAIRALVGNLDLKKRREDVMEGYRALKAQVDAALASGGTTPTDRKTLRALSVLQMKPAFDLTEDELAGLLAELQVAERLGRDVIKDERAAYAAEKALLKEALLSDGAVSPLGQKFRPESLPGEVTSRGADVVEAVRRGFERADKALWALAPIDVVFDALGNSRGDYRSVPTMAFKAPFDAAYSRYIDRVAATFAPVQNLQAELKLSEAQLEKVGAWGALQQEDGRDKLANVYAARMFGAVAEDLSPEQAAQVDAEIDALALTEEETKMYDAIVAMNRAIAPDIARTLRDVYNKEFKAVESYMSFLTDHDAMASAGVTVDEAFDPATSARYEPRRRNVEKGFAKERTGAGRQVIRLDAYDVALKHVNQAAYLIEVGRIAKMNAELANDPAVARALGPIGGPLVKDWTDLVARQGGKAGIEHIGALDELRKNIGLANLGFRLSSIMVQLSAAFDGATLIGGRDMARGLIAMAGAVAKKGREPWRFVFDNMPELRERSGDDPAFVESARRTLRGKASAYGYAGLKAVDKLVAYAAAWGAYRKNLRERGVAFSYDAPDAEAIAAAQLMVRRTQSTSSFGSAPLALTRGAFTGSKSLDRALFQFQSYALTQWSRVRHDAVRAGVMRGDVEGTVKAARIAFWTLASLAATNELRSLSKELVALVTGQGDDGEDEDKKAGRLEELAWAVAGVVPGASNVIGMMRYGSAGLPALDAIRDVADGAGRMLEAKTDETFAKAFADAAGGLGSTAGVPGTGQAASIVKDIVETVYGADPDDAELDLLFGASGGSGRRKPGDGSAGPSAKRKPGESGAGAKKKRKPGEPVD